MQQNKKKVYAAFDFDGTITKYDPTIHFILYSKGAIKTIFGLICLAPALLLYLLKIIPRQKIKETILAQFFGGDSLKSLQEKGAAFVNTSRFKNLIRPEALKRIEWHRSRGDSCMIVSASEDFYLSPFARETGIEHVICSRLQVDNRGKISGKLEGLNCRREEKVRRIIETLGSKSSYLLYAYGDADGDKEMLALADYPFYRTFADKVTA